MSVDRPGAWIHRANLLMEQGRFDEAERILMGVLSHDPDAPEILHLLAYCQSRQAGSEARALETIERAIALEPDEAEHHALRSHVLRDLRRLDDALAAADESIRLDPHLTDTHVARGWVRYRQERWADAEASAREALAIDPDDPPATFLLTESLRLQGRVSQNRAGVAVMLGRDPLDPVGHVSAGWAALQAGERDAAERHFLEALRLDPRSEAAREGLLESFKSRAPWYRAWLRVNLWLARFSRGNRWLILIGLFLVVRFSRSMLRGPLAPFGALLTVLWLGLVLWVHLASGTANAIVLLDGRARHALRPRERLEAIAVGGGVFGGLLLMVVALVTSMRPLAPLGMGLFGSAIPFAYTFTNDSRPGSILFGCIGVLALAAGVVGCAAQVWPGIPVTLATGLAGAAFLAVILTTWIVNVPALKH